MEVKFALNKNLESIFSAPLKGGKVFELQKFGKDEYILFEHLGVNSGEIYTFTKEELRAIWMMLTTR